MVNTTLPLASLFPDGPSGPLKALGSVILTFCVPQIFGLLLIRQTPDPTTTSSSALLKVCAPGPDVIIIPSPTLPPPPPLALTSDIAAHPPKPMSRALLTPSCSVRYSHGQGGPVIAFCIPRCPELTEGRVCFSLWVSERSPVFPGGREMARKTSGGSLMGMGYDTQPLRWSLRNSLCLAENILSLLSEREAHCPMDGPGASFLKTLSWSRCS